MTPQKFLENYNLLPTTPVTAEIMFVFMKNYAKLMCEKQKEICAEEAKMNTADFPKIGINLNSILNSPFPKELQ